MVRVFHFLTCPDEQSPTDKTVSSSGACSENVEGHAERCIKLNRFRSALYPGRGLPAMNPEDVSGSQQFMHRVCARLCPNFNNCCQQDLQPSMTQRHPGLSACEGSG